MIESGKCIILSAPSGSGKTTLVKHLLSFKNLNLVFSISATTKIIFLLKTKNLKK